MCESGEVIMAKLHLGRDDGWLQVRTPLTIETKSGRTEISTCLSYFVSASSAIIKATVYLLLSAAQSMEKIRFVPPCFFLVPTKVKGAGMTLALKRNDRIDQPNVNCFWRNMPIHFWCGLVRCKRNHTTCFSFYRLLQLGPWQFGA